MNNSHDELQLFHRDFLDRSDPTEGLGEQLVPFSLYQVYQLQDKKAAEEICGKLYQKVKSDLENGDLGTNVQWQIVNFQDARYQATEPPRKYIIVRRETNRETRITILARFLPYGKHLYLAMDSFVIGSLNLLSVLWRLAVTILPLLLMWQLGSADSEIRGYIFIFCIIPWIAASTLLLWVNVIRNYRQEGNLWLALRQSFSHTTSSHSFNTDDILMTVKSTMPLILYSIRDILKEEGLPIQTLDGFTENVMAVNNIHVYGSYNAIVTGEGSAKVQVKADM